MMECEVSGNPEPSVVWSRQGSDLPHGSHTSCPASSCLNINSVAREDGGSYTCTADNGVGEEDTANIKLTVQYAPVITVETESIPSGPGNKVVLSCKVGGEPGPSVSWYFMERQLSAGPRMTVKQTRDLHSLTITDIKN